MQRVALAAPTHIFSSTTKKRKSYVDRTAVEWKCVRLTGAQDTKTPIGQCIFCGKVASWTATRIKEHIMGIRQSAACTAESDEFFEMKERLSDKLHSMAAQKSSKLAEERVAMASRPTSQQMSIKECTNAMHREVVDEAVARFVYAENLSLRVVESPHFAELVAAFKSAPSNYKLPLRHRLSGDLLDTVTSKLRAADKPVREALLTSSGCSLLCDGWDDCERKHLINLLYATSSASFFHGTTELSSEQHEDAEAVANFMVEGIDNLSPPHASVFHVVTDTCNVMKAAWKLVESKRQWTSATCCAPHVLNLLLKNIASIRAVSQVMEKMEAVLRRFWGRSRWPRTKLRETTSANHGKPLGLYKAKATRFGGKVRALLASPAPQPHPSPHPHPTDVWLAVGCSIVSWPERYVSKLTCSRSSFHGSMLTGSSTMRRSLALASPSRGMTSSKSSSTRAASGLRSSPS